MTAVGEVQDPQQRHLIIARGALSAQSPVEPTPAELRLTFRVAAVIDGIPFDNGDNTPQYSERMGEALRSQQREIIGGAVVLSIFAVGGAHQATDRQIEAGGAILPLIVAIWDKRRDAVRYLVVS